MTGNAELKAQIKTLTEQVKTLKSTKDAVNDKYHRYKAHTIQLLDEVEQLQKTLHAEKEEKAKILNTARRSTQQPVVIVGAKRALPDSSSCFLEPDPKRPRRQT